MKLNRRQRRKLRKREKKVFLEKVFLDSLQSVAAAKKQVDEAMYKAFTSEKIYAAAVFLRAVCEGEIRPEVGEMERIWEKLKTKQEG